MMMMMIAIIAAAEKKAPPGEVERRMLLITINKEISMRLERRTREAQNIARDQIQDGVEQRQQIIAIIIRRRQ